MRKSMWILVVVATGALSLAAAGCGGGGGSKSSAPPSTTTTESTTTSTTTTNTQPTTTASTATQATTTTQSTTGLSNFVTSGKCKALAAKAQQFSAAAANAKNNLQEQAKLLQQYVDQVPSEIKGDLQTIADAFSKFADAAKAAGYTPGKVPTAAQALKLQQAAKDLQTAKFRLATTHLGAWLQKNCT